MDTQPASFWLNLALLAISGVTGLLVSVLMRKLDGIAADVKEIRDQVGEHTADLARGDQRMNEHERRLDEVEKRLRDVERAAA